MGRLRFAALACAIIVASAASAARAAPCERREFEQSRFTVCLFDSTKQELQLAWTDDQGRAIGAFSRLEYVLGGDASRVEFAMNAGMFEVGGTPLGLYIENGQTRRPINTRDASGNFYMKPNGVFSLDADGTVHVETTEAYAARAPRPQWATQSGPMLVIDGALNPQFSDDGPSHNVRNGVGITGTHTAAFVISDDLVSFGRFARFFRDALHARNALYFDGAISSLWIPSAKRRDDAHLLGPIVFVLERNH